MTDLAKMTCFLCHRRFLYKMQARQNMDLKDIIDCCKKFPEIRLKNVAQSKADL